MLEFLECVYGLESGKQFRLRRDRASDEVILVGVDGVEVHRFNGEDALTEQVDQVDEYLSEHGVEWVEFLNTLRDFADEYMLW